MTPWIFSVRGVLVLGVLEMAGSLVGTGGLGGLIVSLAKGTRFSGGLANFLTFGKYYYLLAPFSVIYGAVLSIFVGTKEFDRWYDLHKGRKHPGEVFVIVWSLLLLVMGSISWIYGKTYTIPNDVISVYVMVLTVFAITQSSKRIYKNKREN